MLFLMFFGLGTLQLVVGNDISAFLFFAAACFQAWCEGRESMAEEKDAQHKA